MNTKLSAEQREALAGGPGPIFVVDPESNRKYLLIEASLFELLQREADYASLQRGIADAEAGRTLSIDEVRENIEAHLRSRSAK